MIRNMGGCINLRWLCSEVCPAIRGVLVWNWIDTRNLHIKPYLRPIRPKWGRLGKIVLISRKKKCDSDRSWCNCKESACQFPSLRVWWAEVWGWQGSLIMSCIHTVGSGRFWLVSDFLFLDNCTSKALRKPMWCVAWFRAPMLQT